MRVWYPGPRDDAVFAELAEALGPGFELFRERPEACDVLIEGRPAPEQLTPIRPQGAVIVPYAGVAHPTVEALRTRPDVTLHNLHHNAAETSETAMALLLAASRRIVTADQALRRGDWTPRYTPEECITLARRTALVLGLGHIGRRIADTCLALGMNVIGIRRSAGGSDRPFPVFPVSELRTHLAKANVLILALPQTDQTNGLIGAEEIGRLRRPALLVNIARAAIVAERDLYEALAGGALHAAGLDVWYRYPKHPEGLVPGYFDMPAEARSTFPSDYPFHELPNVVMSPHRGGSSADAEASRIRHLAVLLRQRRDSGHMDNLVDLEAGY